MSAIKHSGLESELRFFSELPWPALLLNSDLRVLAQSRGWLLANANHSLLQQSLLQIDARARSQVVTPGDGPSLVEIAQRVLAQQSEHTIHDCDAFSAAGMPAADVSFQPLDLPSQTLLLLRFSWQKPELAHPHALLRQIGRALAHEIANPLAGLKGVAQLLAKRAPELAQYTSLLVHETDRIHDLLGRIRGHSFSQTSLLNIHQALDQALAVASAQFPDCTILRDYDPSLPEIHGDLAALTQLALNLLLNAAQAQANQIQVRTRAEHQVPLGAKMLRTAIRIDIRDNGTGVSDELRDTLFLPLVTGKSSGSGFGLASALAITEEHGGAIRFVSQAHDTCFSVYLPLQGT